MYRKNVYDVPIKYNSIYNQTSPPSSALIFPGIMNRKLKLPNIRHTPASPGDRRDFLHLHRNSSSELLSSSNRFGVRGAAVALFKRDPVERQPPPHAATLPAAVVLWPPLEVAV